MCMCSSLEFQTFPGFLLFSISLGTVKGGMTLGCCPNSNGWRGVEESDFLSPTVLTALIGPINVGTLRNYF